MKIGFDLISDLYLAPGDEFNWEGKATSLYCLIAGNISYDLRTISNTLAHLSKFYQGVFYTPGALEFKEAEDIPNRIFELNYICKRIPHVVFLHQQVVIIDGVAVLGCNGWIGNLIPAMHSSERTIEENRHNDIVYLKNSIEKLQKHCDVTRIFVLTNSVPNKDLYFGEIPRVVKYQPELALTHMLDLDSEAKISHWAYGTYEKLVDTNINGVNYVANPSFDRNPYWAKRIDVEV
jgi:hypothetical protein